MAWGGDPVGEAQMVTALRGGPAPGMAVPVGATDSYPKVWNGSMWVYGPTSAPPPSAVAVSTGVNPMETSYALYGHVRPILVIGKARIGSEIISGPWIESGVGTGILGLGVEADPTRTRTLVELAFDSEVVWRGSQVGAGALASSGFLIEPFTCRFYDGKFDQPADAIEIAKFGANAVAYRPEALIAIENLPLANTKFGKFPYVSGVMVDEDGEAITFGEAFERLAASPFVEIPDFETSGLTDGVPNGGLIFAQDDEFLATIQRFGKYYPNWDILQTDKLRVVDRGSTVTADLVLDATRLMDKVTINRAGPDMVRRDLELSTIDPDADYSIVPYKVQRPRAPLPVTTSVGLDSDYLPVIMDADTRAVIATFARYHQEVARKTITGTAMIYALEMEPGALVKFKDLSDDFRNETFRIFETLHGANNVVEFVGQAILKCSIVDYPAGELLMGFEGADGSTGAPGMVDEGASQHGTATVFGDAHIDTSQSKFGSSSLRLDGSSDWIYFPDDPDWVLSSANSDEFTVEFFIRFAGFTNPRNRIVLHGFTGGGAQSWDFSTEGLTGEFSFRSSSDGASFNVTVTSSGAALTTGVWYHLAADKDSSGKIRIYKDGVMVGSDTPADSSMFPAPHPLYIGNIPGGNGVNGWIDEMRIHKGIARYASDSGFTVPTAAFPRG